MFDNIHPISISTRACAEIHKIMRTKGIPPDYGLRVGVKGGGCGGVSLIIGFDRQNETDHSYVIEGIPVYVDKKHTMYLMGKEVDFLDESEARGFIFVDPANAEN
jgi:iron-sulfur cluster assembly protein